MVEENGQEENQLVMRINSFETAQIDEQDHEEAEVSLIITQNSENIQEGENNVFNSNEANNRNQISQENLGGPQLL